MRLPGVSLTIRRCIRQCLVGGASLERGWSLMVSEGNSTKQRTHSLPCGLYVRLKDRGIQRNA
jgi:hypothetical protein